MTPRAIARHLTGWRNARRYGVPAAMVATATRRRLAGDWRGAAEAAGFDVRFDLAQVRQDFGAEVAARVEDDLRHLAPDLVRWHLPREPCVVDGLFEANIAVPLARYDHEHPAVLWVRTPSYLLRPQRIELQLTRAHWVRRRGGRASDSWTFLMIPIDDWTDTRDLWDARAAPGLGHRINGGDVELTDRVVALQDAGRIAEAWAAGGIAATFEGDETWFTTDAYALVPALRAAVVGHMSTEDGPVDVMLRPRAKTASFAIVLTVDGPSVSAKVAPKVSATVEEFPDITRLPAVPRSWWQRLPELELLRRGQLELSGLHPLVRAGLFPDDAGDPDEYRPIPVVDPEPVRVRCRGEWHRVGWREGQITALDHSPAEVGRERVMDTLGAKLPGCFRVTTGWHDGPVGSRPLRPLRRLRHHGVLAMRHGDLDEILRLLDLGLDPAGLRDDTGRDPLHYLAHLGCLPLLHRLLAAGLDVNRRAGRPGGNESTPATGLHSRNGRSMGRSPLAWAVFDGAPAALVNALLDAGADPTVIDDGQANLLHLLRGADVDGYLPRLIAAGLDLEARDWRGCPALLAQVLGDAPPAVIRASIAAGADPHARASFGNYAASNIVINQNRADLRFLLE